MQTSLPYIVFCALLFGVPFIISLAMPGWRSLLLLLALPGSGSLWLLFNAWTNTTRSGAMIRFFTQLAVAGLFLGIAIRAALLAWRRNIARPPRIGHRQDSHA